MKALEELYDTIQKRKQDPEPGSYTSYLFDKGLDKILKKVGEENTEVVIAALMQTKTELVCEIADLLYHLEVLMVEKDITILDIENELMKRSNKIHNLKSERRPIDKY